MLKDLIQKKITFPFFNKLFLSEDLKNEITENVKIKRGSEARSLFGSAEFEMFQEKSLPSKCGIFMDDKTIVAIYKNGEILIIPYPLPSQLEKEPFRIKL